MPHDYLILSLHYEVEAAETELQKFLPAYKPVKLPNLKGSRQSIMTELPSKIVLNLPLYLSYIHHSKAENSQNKLVRANRNGLGDKVQERGPRQNGILISHFHFRDSR